ncbi:hypothetical protein [Alteromonas sp. a30]|uniref:hypothetical protein n=1 Tax=Alteromonas sp. a30 TaxID=2730917 RepID=UPI00228015E4|nr:hypothetical protein [Alteromonas sp. a30]MCY7297462.1 hypothetical protein [Alteromonas sp. a30]
MKNLVIKVVSVLTLPLLFFHALANSNFEVLYISKENIERYQIEINVSENDEMINLLNVEVLVGGKMSHKCELVLSEALLQIGNNGRVISALPIELNVDGTLSYMFDIEKGFLSQTTLTLFYNESGTGKEGCNINSNYPVVIEFENWLVPRPNVQKNNG